MDMSTGDFPASAVAAPLRTSWRARLMDKVGTALLERVLRRLQCGRLVVELPSGRQVVAKGRSAGREAFLMLHNWRPLWALMADGDNGFAESYVDGHWSTPDLASFLLLMAENLSGLDGEIAGLWPARMTRRAYHLLHRNSRRGSRRNIAMH